MSSDSGDDASFEAARSRSIGMHGSSSIDRIFDDYYWCELCGEKIPSRFKSSHEQCCSARLAAMVDDSHLTAVNVEPGDDAPLTAVKVEPGDDDQLLKWSHGDDDLTAVKVEPCDDDLTAVKVEPCDDDLTAVKVEHGDDDTISQLLKWSKALIDPNDLAIDDDVPPTPEGDDPPTDVDDQEDMVPPTPEGDDQDDMVPPTDGDDLYDAPWRPDHYHDRSSGSREQPPTQQHAGKKSWGSKRAGGARVQAGRALRNAEVDMIGEADGSPDLESLLGESWPEQFKMVTQRLSASRDDAAATLRIFMGLGKEFRAALCRTMVDRSLHEEPIAYLK